ncbi:adenylate/guanylate cyclase domain-containing protein [Lusitaniella coriacea]|uniref:adenylate/guanylate cyclase domain-containing protein n=1 Tax=Lusitaniella coriacea TaxID=1983105 RepID=UPI003CF7FE33
MPYILVCNPDSAKEKRFELKEGRNTLGRSANNQIAIANDSLSRQHAEIIVTRDCGLMLKDKDSLNGTFVNKVRIKEREIQHGDWILCGRVPFKLVDTALEVESPPEDFDRLTIIKEISPQQEKIAIGDILEREKKGGSALKLRQQDSQQRTTDKLKILLEVSKQLSTPQDLEQLLEKILDLLMEIMAVDRAAILLLDEQTGQLRCQAARSRPEVSLDYPFYSTKIVNFVYKKGKAILTDDAAFDQRFDSSRSIIAQAIRASMCVPLQPNDCTIGVLYADNLFASNLYSEEDLEFLTALANQAAIAIENANLNRRMQAEERIRGKLERFFPEAISRKLREDGQFGIVDTEVTALFADIAGFTAMSSHMKPRTIIAMLNDYFQVMVEEIVFAYEGTLEKYIGDALLAVWGAPYSQPDDAERAVRAAIQMQQAVNRCQQKWIERYGHSIAIHIGLNTGKVAAGNIGSQRLIQYATIGDTTNVTSRICNVAKAGEIVISQSTYAQLKNRAIEPIPLEPLPPVTVKGKEDPLQLHRVLWETMDNPTALQLPSLTAL